MDSKTKVNILNREYVLRGDLDPEYINYLAEKLNKRIEELKKLAPQKMDDLHLVILTALNLLDEAELNNQNVTPVMSDDDVVKKTSRMINMLEKGIIGEIY